MLVGQARVGKTSLKKSLKGDQFDAHEKSTSGIEVDPSHCKVTTEIWRPGEANRTAGSDSAISFDHHAAQMIACSLTTEKETRFKGAKLKAESGKTTKATNNTQPRMVQSFSSQDARTASRATRQEQEHENPEMPEDLANLTQKFISKDVELDEQNEIHSIL